MKYIRSFLRARPDWYNAARTLVTRWRRWRYRTPGVDKTAYLAEGSRISPDFVAHEFSYVGSECIVGPKVELGAYSMLGPRVVIVGADHVFDQPGVPIIFSGRPTMKRTLIQRDVWIGGGAILIAGVTIGRGSIVAAGAVVTRDVPDFEIHGGVPAKRIRDRFPNCEARKMHEQMLAQPPSRGVFCPPLEIAESRAA